jgi:hypothetical protein
MKVRELIEKLSACDQDANVAVPEPFVDRRGGYRMVNIRGLDSVESVPAWGVEAAVQLLPEPHPGEACSGCCQPALPAFDANGPTGLCFRCGTPLPPSYVRPESHPN